MSERVSERALFETISEDVVSAEVHAGSPVAELISKLMCHFLADV